MGSYAKWAKGVVYHENSSELKQVLWTAVKMKEKKFWHSKHLSVNPIAALVEYNASNKQIYNFSSAPQIT